MARARQGAGRARQGQGAARAAARRADPGGAQARAARIAARRAPVAARLVRGRVRTVEGGGRRALAARPGAREPPAPGPARRHPEEARRAQGEGGRRMPALRGRTSREAPAHRAARARAGAGAPLQEGDRPRRHHDQGNGARHPQALGRVPQPARRRDARAGRGAGRGAALRRGPRLLDQALERPAALARQGGEPDLDRGARPALPRDPARDQRVPLAQGRPAAAPDRRRVRDQRRRADPRRHADADRAFRPAPPDRGRELPPRAARDPLEARPGALPVAGPVARRDAARRVHAARHRPDAPP